MRKLIVGLGLSCTLASAGCATQYSRVTDTVTGAVYVTRKTPLVFSENQPLRFHDWISKRDVEVKTYVLDYYISKAAFDAYVAGGTNYPKPTGGPNVAR